MTTFRVVDDHSYERTWPTGAFMMASIPKGPLSVHNEPDPIEWYTLDVSQTCNFCHVDIVVENGQWVDCFGGHTNDCPFSPDGLHEPWMEDA